ncbi:MAG: glycosyltransferase family 2 protein [Thiobacillus sp.]
MDNFDPTLISVVMPCYNARPYVREAIVSVLHQTYASWELLIVDDGSTDGSTDIIEELAAVHPKRIRVIYQNRVGPSAARNLALAQARGNYLAFLDADDYWLPSALAKLHAVLVDAPADVAYCGWQHVGPLAENLQPQIPIDINDKNRLEYFLKACPWPINGVLIQRQLIDSLRGFSERRATAMDYDLWLRMLTQQPRMVRVPEVLAFYRHYAGSGNGVPRWRQVFDTVGVREDFVRHHRDITDALSPARRRALLYDTLLSEAYRCHWRRNTQSSRRLFLRAFFKTDWKIGDLKYMLASFMPGSIFDGLIRYIDARRSARSAL